MGSYVYLAEAGGLFKIGTTGDPSERLRQLAKRHQGFRYLCVIATKYQRQAQCLERALQRLFANKHIGNEWFRFTEADIERFKVIQPSDLSGIHFNFIHLGGRSEGDRRCNKWP